MDKWKSRNCQYKITHICKWRFYIMTLITRVVIAARTKVFSELTANGQTL